MAGQMKSLDLEGLPEGRASASWRKGIVGERHVIDRGSDAYPESLRLVRNPPERLRVIGDPGALQEGLAVIGARKATPYGLGCAARFAGMAAQRGIAIVSGGAFGCDSQAHKAALDAGGKTVVFFGGGCDHVYPSRNLELFQRVVDAGGAVVSERDWEEAPQPWMFRERNRLIAGLAKATLVVEAGLPSGTFSTADAALAANRDVLVVPGAITSPTSAGSNRLLAQGATPIIDDESFESALFLLFGVPSSHQMRRKRQREDPLLRALNANPMRMEAMLELDLPGGDTGLDRLTRLTIRLGELEREGLIARYPDGRYGPTVR